MDDRSTGTAFGVTGTLALTTVGYQRQSFGHVVTTLGTGPDDGAVDGISLDHCAYCWPIWLCNDIHIGGTAE